MPSKLVRAAVVEYTCDWCGDAEEHPSDRPLIGWFNLVRPHALSSAFQTELLCPPCGMRATSVLHDAAATRLRRGGR